MACLSCHDADETRAWTLHLLGINGYPGYGIFLSDPLPCEKAQLLYAMRITLTRFTYVKGHDGGQGSLTRTHAHQHAAYPDL